MNKLQEDTKRNPSFLEKARNFILNCRVATAITLGCLSFSSCNDNKPDLSELRPRIEIIPEYESVDIEWWKMIRTEWNTLKIWDKTVAIRDKNCWIWIEYENDTTTQKKNLIETTLDKTWKIYIYLTPDIETSLIPEEILQDEEKYEKFREKISVKFSLILYTSKGPIIPSKIKTPSVEWESAEPIKPVKTEEIFPNLSDRISNKDMTLIEQAWVAEGYQMIQSLLNNGTTNLTPEECKKHIESINIVFASEDPNWDNIIFKRIIPNAKKNIIKDDNTNSWISKTIKHAHAHPEEIIIIYYSTNKDENIESNHEKEINELRNLDNVLFIEWTYSSTEIAIIWMAAQLDPNIKNSKDLENLIKSSALHIDEDFNWNQQKSVPIPDIWLIIRKLSIPQSLPDSINNDDSKNKIKIWQ